jgi:tetratricopeptide (TPR) repeat protein
MEREQKLATDLNPNYWEGHRRYGMLLRNLGRFDEARAAFKRALEIDPLAPVTNLENARLLFFEGKYDEGESVGIKNVKLDPNFGYGHLHLHDVHRMKRNYPAAVEELAKLQESRGEPDAAKFIRESFIAGDWRGYLKNYGGACTAQTLSIFHRNFLCEAGREGQSLCRAQRGHRYNGSTHEPDESRPVYGSAA